MTTHRSLPKKIHALCKARGLDRRALAKKAGIRIRDLDALQAGMRLSLLRHVARALAVPYGTLHVCLYTVKHDVRFPGKTPTMDRIVAAVGKHPGLRASEL